MRELLEARPRPPVVSSKPIAKHAFAPLALCALGALALAGGAAYGQAPRPTTVEFRGTAMTEFRGYGFIRYALEDDIWRLAPDGRATLVYVRRRGTSDFSGSGTEGGDEGTWSRRDGQICVEWRVRRDISGCYTIIPKFGIHVRLVGPVAFEGTLE